MLGLSTEYRPTVCIVLVPLVPCDWFENLTNGCASTEEAIAVLESGGTKLKQVAIIKKEQAITFGKQGVETVEQELKKLQLSHLPSSLHTLLLTCVKGLRQEVGQSMQTSVRHAVAATLQMHQHGARRGSETLQVCAKVSVLLRHRAAELHRSALGMCTCRAPWCTHVPCLHTCTLPAHMHVRSCTLAGTAVACAHT